MTALTGTRTRRSLIGLAVQLLHARAQSKGARGSRLAAALQDHMMTLAALAAADMAGFRLWHSGGWLVLAVTLLLADFKLQSG